MKVCNDCKVEKTADHYYKETRRGATRLAPYCMECFRSRNKQYRDRRKQEPDYKDRRWNSTLKERYGISLSDYKKRLTVQQNKCALCREEFVSSRLTHLDHCHKTGKVRDLLCNHCNRGIGAFKDNPELCELAAQYLRKHI